MEFPNFKKESKEKPPFLYHASTDPEIGEFEPKRLKIRDEKEGPKVFATPSRELASIFLVPTDDSWAGSGTFGGAWYFVCKDEKRFRELDKGSFLYKVPSDSFDYNPNIGLGEDEWTSGEKVKPISKEKITSALEEMLNQGVQVYFVNQEVFDAFEKKPRAEILKKLVSENQKKGIGVKPLQLEDDLGNDTI